MRKWNCKQKKYMEKWKLIKKRLKDYVSIELKSWKKSLENPNANLENFILLT